MAGCKLCLRILALRGSQGATLTGGRSSTTHHVKTQALDRSVAAYGERVFTIWCLNSFVRLQALEKSVEAGGALDSYEIEGPDRAELLQDLAEFQLAAVSPLPDSHNPLI